MGRADLVVASNRGPVSFTLDESGRPVRAGTGGGLAATLGPLLEGSGASWVACAMSDGDRIAASEGLVQAEATNLYMVRPDPDTYRGAYEVVANSTLWFCHHNLFDLARRPRIDGRWQQAWDSYRVLNQEFASVVCEIAAPDAVVLVQDYHLCLLPGMLAESRPDLRSVHFTHTPFADPSALRVLPASAARELLLGMSASMGCGFHTTRWESAFVACCADNGVSPPRTFVSPLSPDPAHLARRAATPECRAAGDRLESLWSGRKLILSVDRVEPSKNLLRGFWAFNEMLESYPELRGEAVLVALTYPSRQSLPEYLAYGAEVEHTARYVNQRWGDPSWTPIVLDVADDANRSVAALARYDVLLVNPIRDGLNLVAKEGPLLNETDGVLALSREAGAFAELGPEALELNPFDVAGTAHALARALKMEPSERKQRASALRSLVMGRTPGEWLAEQLSLVEAHTS